MKSIPGNFFPIFCTFLLAVSTVVSQSSSSQEADSLTPSERCEACQIVLKTVYGHFFKQVSSRRKLAHQLKHECNRHYQYRRRCLLFTRTNNLEIIFHEMGATEFKPINACTVLKECFTHQSLRHLKKEQMEWMRQDKFQR
ncbi:unnamed protein product, partial [Mesorhabditis belari]|uniref:Saposin B-type domain-containing protein n=1 Tax=Mesorhabditis belari TaxID=2138241 RepID=A0AAF3F8G5_9BILA